MTSRLRNSTVLSIALLFVAASVVSGQSTPRPDAAKLEFFEKKIRPLLIDNCYNCHSANNKSEGGLRVDDRNGLLQGGGRGAAIVSGSPDKSLLLRAVSHTDGKLKMPPEKKLTDEQIADLTQWIADGSAWPPVELPAGLGKWSADYEKSRKEHWAWQPLKTGAPPVVRNEAWVRDDFDRFIIARLEQQGLAPVPDADKVSLLRRVSFDLTGLPPTPAEIEAFLNDAAPAAFETVVDRLLSSPAYGERWGRHWLDVARYGESTGSARNLPYPHAWRYRDYVIDAFTQDKPYDQFLREQIAGDLLPAASEAERDEHLVATGFLALGVKDVNQRFKIRYVMDNIDEQIDTVTRSILALTVSCARCHDHKFDPVPVTDYYALAGIFRSTDLCAGLRNKMGGGGLDYYDTSMLLTLKSHSGPARGDLTEKVASAKAAFEAAKAEFEAIRGTPEGMAPDPNGRPKQQAVRQKMTRLQAELSALADPAVTGAVAMGARDSKTIGDTEIRLRGEAEKLGPVVPRGFLSVLQLSDAPKLNPSQSGRLELAQWFTSAENPLTSRVMANRVWQHLFGQGLVRTVDNFGVTGDAPSHPELLDHLATRFVREGWSVKKLVRSVVLSHAYQLGSETPEKHRTFDPSNRLVWRHSPRRLDAEEIRDATLAASGKLDLSRPAASPAKDLKVTELRNNGPEAQRLVDAGRTSRHRSVYLPLLRTLVPPSLEVFDFAEQGMVTGRRDSTTVPTQALYLLNDPLVRKHALTLAESLVARDLDESERLQRAYLIALGRQPTTSEIERARFYLTDYEAIAQQVLADEFASAAMSAKVKATADSAEPAPADASTPQNVAVVVNPDDVDQSEAVVPDEVIQARDAHTAAWASYLQALFGSAEFRYVR